MACAHQSYEEGNGRTSFAQGGDAGQEPLTAYQETVMVVDDDPATLHFLNGVLTEIGYGVQVLPDGAMAIEAAQREPPHLVLLDIEMPGMNGYEVCEWFKSHETLKDIPVLFISGLDDVVGKIRAFDCGGEDFISKPFNVDEVHARIETRLENRRLHLKMKRHNEELSLRVEQQVREISEAQLATIQALARLTESRDDETGYHVERVQRYSKILVRQLQRSRVAPDVLTDTFAHQLFHAAALHDIGKVGIPDAVLRKKGKLSTEEFELMKTHTIIGSTTLSSVLHDYPGNALLRTAQEVALAHHEKYDGTGYPMEASGKNIPWSARIVALADAYDAIRSKRPYKEPISHDEAVGIIGRASGSHFDPVVVAAFIAARQEFEGLSLADD